MRRTWLLVCILCLGIAQAEKPQDSKPPVFVSLPWQITPYNILRQMSEPDSYHSYGKRFQRDLISILTAKGILALPAMYGSNIQAFNYVSSRGQLDSMIALEPAAQRDYLTIVPVFTSTTASKAPLSFGKLWNVNIDFSLHLQQKNGSLGGSLMSQRISTRVHTKNVEWEYDDYSAADSLLALNLTGLPCWKIVADSIKNIQKNSSGYKSVPDFSTGTYPKDLTRQYFGQAEAILYDHSGLIHIEKENFYTIGKKVEDVSDLIFGFDLSCEVPIFLYSYIFTPEKKLISITRDNIHFEQPPDAVPTKVYTDKRLMVIDLPGLVPGATVFFCVAFLSTYSDKVPDLYSLSKKHHVPLAKDVSILYGDTSVAWDVRVAVPSTDTVHAGQDSVGEFSRKDVTIGYRNLSIFSGKNGVINNGLFEPFHKIPYKTLRLSTLTTWQALYGDIRDSIYLRIKNVASLKPSRYEKNRDAVTGAVYDDLRYFRDSLRYVANMITGLKTIPQYPDSVLASKTGDCKDFSALLINRLAKKNIMALPALVNSYNDRAVFAGPPSFDAFNHMVVYLPAQEWWIDPTAGMFAPWIIPDYLCKSTAVVLYDKDLALRKIGENPDSIAADSILYEYSMAGDTVRCAYTRVCSWRESFYIRDWLRSTPEDKRASEMFPANSKDKRGSISEDSLSFINADSFQCRLIVKRRFTAGNALSRVGTQTLFSIPELPHSWMMDYVEQAKRESEFAIQSTSLKSVTISMPQVKKATWPEIAAVNNKAFGIESRIKKNRTAATVKIILRETTFPAQEYNDFRKTILSYRDFFLSPMLVSY
jgi:hypothetical protein